MTSLRQQVKAIIDSSVPPLGTLARDLEPCLTLPAVRHLPVVGVRPGLTLGQIYGICTLPIGHQCGNHKKLSPVQLAPNRLRILSERVRALHGPGLQDEYVHAHLTEHADGPQPALGRPHLRTAVVDVLIYLQDGEPPISLPLEATVRGKLLEFVFQQPITRDILSVNRAVTYESYNPRLRQFVPYPRSYDKRYILAGDVLVYRRSDVQDCPSLRHLARRFAPSYVGGGEGSDDDSEGEGEGEESDDGNEAPLPSLITHAVSWSNYRGSSTDSESVPATPRRSLRLRQSTARSASTRGAVRRAGSASSSTPSTSQGGKRKRGYAGASSPRKRARTSGTVASHMVLGKDGAIWEVVDEEISIKMTN